MPRTDSFTFIPGEKEASLNVGKIYDAICVWKKGNSFNFLCTLCTSTNTQIQRFRIRTYHKLTNTHTRVGLSRTSIGGERLSERNEVRIRASRSQRRRIVNNQMAFRIMKILYPQVVSTGGIEQTRMKLAKKSGHEHHHAERFESVYSSRRRKSKVL